MDKLMKWLLGSLLLVLLIVIVAVFVVAANLGSLVKTAINEQGPAMTGIDLSVQDVDVNLLGAQAAVQGLRVGNPPGYSEGDALELGSVSLALDRDSLQRIAQAGSLSAAVIVVDDIRINGARVFAEHKGNSTNLQALQKQLAAVGGGSSSTSNAGKGEPAKLAIRRFEFSDAQVSVSSDQFDDQQVEVPAIVLTDIGSPEQGVTAANAAQALLRPVLQEVIKQVQKQALDKVIDKEINRALDKALGDKAGQLKEGLKGLFNR